MNALRIFIASSTPTQDLAEQLSDRIIARAREFPVEPILWWETFEAGEATLENLISECKICDFAVIFLTEDDVKLTRGLELLQPRDNCIFEAGLFTGALSLDPKRVFLLTSLKNAAHALPSDLAGIVYIPLKVSGTPAEIDRSINNAARMIVEQMKQKGPHHRGEIAYIPEDELMSFERLEGEAGKLVAASRIFVHTGQPMEAFHPGFAERVQRNIKNKIRYRYFFYADITSLSMIAQLIWTLGAAGVEGATLDDKDMEMRQNPKRVLDNLEAIHRHLNIHFLLEEPKFELCVHNSEVGPKAVCYLRVPRSDPVKFILWCAGPPAKDIADSFLALRKGSPTDSIFRSTNTFDLEEKSDYLDRLCRVITERFPDSIKDDVSKLCFGK